MGPWLLAGAANGFVAVAMGAFAAHGLKAVLDPAALAWVETGSRYELTHALALVAVALLIRDAPDASRASRISRATARSASACVSS